MVRAHIIQHKRALRDSSSPLVSHFLENGHLSATELKLRATQTIKPLLEWRPSPFFAPGISEWIFVLVNAVASEGLNDELHLFFFSDIFLCL